MALLSSLIERAIHAGGEGQAFILSYDPRNPKDSRWQAVLGPAEKAKGNPPIFVATGVSPKEAVAQLILKMEQP